MRGRISFFGGTRDCDKGMTRVEGLAVWEHAEADVRPDLFRERASDPTEGTAMRLRDSALYFAMRYGNIPRSIAQRTAWLFRNPETGLSVVCSLVDWGPHETTGREFDLSWEAGRLLKLKTDEWAEGYPL